MFIPALEYKNGSVEVFTTKFGGILFGDMVQATEFAKGNGESCWQCATHKIAKSRAKDKTLSPLFDLDLSQVRPLSIKINKDLRAG